MRAICVPDHEEGPSDPDARQVLRWGRIDACNVETSWPSSRCAERENEVRRPVMPGMSLKGITLDNADEKLYTAGLGFTCRQVLQSRPQGILNR